MKTLSLIACCSLAFLFTGLGCSQTNDLAAWAEQAVSPHQNVAQTAQAHLRAAGPSGLEALEQRFAKEILEHKNGAGGDSRWKRIGAALDRVGGQHDNYASGLYWYTDLETAKAAARVARKPILSLRLLGRLDEDLSCANSRFFRTTLYPNAEINQLLRDRFVLHWESVRPAPKVTIDFGDGRKLVRTITGNSIHYILDHDGNLVDTLPGLYSAPVFVAELERSADAVKEAREQGSHDYTPHLKEVQARLLHAWAADLAAIHVSLPAGEPITEDALERLVDNQKWQQISRLPTNAAAFDLAVNEVVARKMPGPWPVRAPKPSGAKNKASSKFPPAPVAAPLAMTKAAVETPVLREMRNLANTIALDTVRNNYMLRTKILEYLNAANGRSLSLAEINNWVYDRIFLTPGEDPWLGLAPPDVFSAIDKNGEGQ